MYFQWDDVTKEAGYHDVEWDWYQADITAQKATALQAHALTTWSQHSAGSLGVGHFAVATVVDGAVVSTSNFEIR